MQRQMSSKASANCPACETDAAVVVGAPAVGIELQRGAEVGEREFELALVGSGLAAAVQGPRGKFVAELAVLVLDACPHRGGAIADDGGVFGFALGGERKLVGADEGVVGGVGLGVWSRRGDALGWFWCGHRGRDAPARLLSRLLARRRGDVAGAATLAGEYLPAAMCGGNDGCVLDHRLERSLAAAIGDDREGSLSGRRRRRGWRLDGDGGRRRRAIVGEDEIAGADGIAGRFLDFNAVVRGGDERNVRFVGQRAGGGDSEC
jgi:hypothetical protein